MSWLLCADLNWVNGISLTGRHRFIGGLRTVDSTSSNLRDLDDYVQRRFQLAGGALNDGLADGSLYDALKSVYLRPLDTLRAEFERKHRNFVSFANYDYAGLADDPRVRQAACDAIMSVGVGAGASRLVGGERAIHGALEKDLAAFLGVDDAITLVSGYMTNVSLVGHVLTKHDVILVDDLSHNSIIVGTDVSRARVMRFAHNDLDHLETILKQVRREANRVLIIVEGLYSMDGDIADLPRLLDLRDRYGAWLMVDEAHSLGVLGATGRGLAEHFGIDPRQIDMTVGTLSKTLAACGGFIAGSKRMIDWLRFTLPAFVFSVGLSPALSAAAQEGIRILQVEQERIVRQQHNSREFLKAAQCRGLDVGSAAGAGVVPVLFSGQRECLFAAQSLLSAGYFAPPILQLAVPKDKPRIRFFISAMHTASQISGAVEALSFAIGRMRSVIARRRKPRNAALRAAGLGGAVNAGFAPAGPG
jgi:8-amino-7-oxononanoate synthase